MGYLKLVIQFATEMVLIFLVGLFLAFIAGLISGAGINWYFVGGLMLADAVVFIVGVFLVNR